MRYGNDPTHRRQGRVGLRPALLLLVAAVFAAFFAAPAGAVQITEFPLPAGSRPLSITAGPDGYMWFTDTVGDTIGKIGMAGEVTLYSLGITPAANPTSITSGPEGNLFFTEQDADKIGRITTGGAVTEFSAGLSPNSHPFGITLGPENYLWFTETNGRIGTLNPATGVISEFSGPAGVYTAITRGPGGNLWYTAVDQATINRVTPAREFNSYGPLSGVDCAVGAPPPCPFPSQIALGSEGNLWTNEERGNALVRVTPAGAISEFSDGLTRGASVTGLAAGPEGNMWFAETAADQVGRITPTGVITEFHEGLTKEAQPRGIALGPDHNLWVTEYAKDQIARVIPDVPPIVATGGVSNVLRTHATVLATVRSRGADTHYYFEYGPLGTYVTGTPQGDNGSGDSTNTVSAELKHLKPGKAYQYRIIAQNANGTGIGSDGSFTTAPPGKHKKKKKHHKHKLTVKPFQMYVAGSSDGHRVQLHKITVFGVHRGDEVSLRCMQCQGGPARAHRRASGARLVFPTRLKVGSDGRMQVSVSARNGSKRVKLYGFRVSDGETKLRGQRCFAGGKKHKPVSCASYSQPHKKKHHHKKK